MIGSGTRATALGNNGCGMTALQNGPDGDQPRANKERGQQGCLQNRK
jgi:hypothetical protein